MSRSDIEIQRQLGANTINKSIDLYSQRLEEGISGKMGLEDIFKEAAERVKQLPEASNDDQLELYSLFKQSNMGDCNTARPGGLFNMKDKAKWDAWNGRKGMGKDDAMRAYVDKVDSLCGTSFATKI